MSKWAVEEIDHLSVEDLLDIAAGVTDHVAIRDVGLLAAAAGRPQVTVFGDDAYPTFTDKAAALLHSLVRNHALVDGNNHLAWSAIRVFCLLNGPDLTYTVDEAEDLMLSTASGQLDVPDIPPWLKATSSPRHSAASRIPAGRPSILRAARVLSRPSRGGGRRCRWRSARLPSHRS